MRPTRSTRPVPIWIADYVRLASYGTGVIMAVPAHDTRDFELAVQFELPIVPVVDPGETPGIDRDEVLAGKAVFPGEGTAINSGSYDGLATGELKRIAADLASCGQGREAVNYKLRDWLFSRQHFWGESVSDFMSWMPRAIRRGCCGPLRRRICRSICRSSKSSLRTAAPSRRWSSARRVAVSRH